MTNILNKIAEYRRDIMKAHRTPKVYRVADGDLNELLNRLTTMHQGTWEAENLIFAALKSYKLTNDISFLKRWFDDNPTLLFGMKLIPDSPHFTRSTFCG